MNTFLSNLEGVAIILIWLVIWFLPGIICGVLCNKLSKAKFLPYPYFWTGFLLNVIGLVYVAGLSAVIPGPEEG